MAGEGPGQEGAQQVAGRRRPGGGRRVAAWQGPCTLHPAPCRCPDTHLLLSSVPVRVLRSSSRYFGRAEESWALAGSSRPPPAGKGSIERFADPRSSWEALQKLRGLGPDRKG